LSQSTRAAAEWIPRRTPAAAGCLTGAGAEECGPRCPPIVTKPVPRPGLDCELNADAAAHRVFHDVHALSAEFVQEWRDLFRPPVTIGLPPKSSLTPKPGNSRYQATEARRMCANAAECLRHIRLTPGPRAVAGSSITGASLRQDWHWRSIASTLGVVIFAQVGFRSVGHAVTLPDVLDDDRVVIRLVPTPPTPRVRLRARKDRVHHPVTPEDGGGRGSSCLSIASASSRARTPSCNGARIPARSFDPRGLVLHPATSNIRSWPCRGRRQSRT